MDIIITYYVPLIFTAITGAIGTYLLHNNYSHNISPVFASASLTLCIALICHYIPNQDLLLIKEIPYVFIGGSFIGMSTRKKTKAITNIIYASLIFALIYFKSSQFFQGYGGALGLSACMSVLIVITFNKLFIRSKHFIRKRRYSRNKK